MPAATTPVASVTSLSRERLQPLLKPARKRFNPLQIIALLAIVLFCALGLARALHNSSSTNMVKVLEPTRDIPAGVRVGFMMFHYMDIPRQYATRDMVVNLADVVDHETRTFIPAAEPVRKSMFFPDSRGLAANLLADERAITLQLTDDALIDHTIRPDDRVDVLVASSTDGKKYTKTICQAARVLMSTAKGELLVRHMGASANNKITLAVAPSMTEALNEAAEVGKIRLVLRNRNEGKDLPLHGAEPKDLLPDGILNTVSTAVHSTILPSLAALPSPPLLPSFAQNIGSDKQVAPAKNPIEWIVEIISGSKKESVSVPEQ